MAETAHNVQNLQLMADRILVLPEKAETKTASGLIHIPEQAKDKPAKGVVMATGPGLADLAMNVTPGQTVVYSKYAGTELHHRGNDYLIVRMADIIAVEHSEEKS